MRRGQAHVVLEWKVPPGQAQPITTALNRVMFSTQKQIGCLGCAVRTSASDHVTVIFTEDWATEEDLRQHVRSEDFRVIATLIESASAPPRIEFVLPEGTRGFDYATEVCEES